MKIGSSNVYMESGHQFQAQQTNGSSQTIGNSTLVHENTIMYKEEERTKILDFTNMLKDEMIDDATADMEQSMLGMRSKSATASRIADVNDLRSFRKIQEQTIMYLLKHFRELFMQSRFNRNSSGPDFQEKLREAGGEQKQQFIAPVYQLNMPVQGNVIGSLSSYSYYGEEEKTAFTTKGKVVTEDGREIDFDIDVTMSRSFEEYYMQQTDIYAMQPTDNLVDPLVINLNGNVAEVSNQKFMFDLDADGNMDEISSLGSGSGFLALDKNKDGKINDGSELFGTKSGDGFKDLAKYDLDGNGWIDENDEIFDQLKIWTKDAKGSDVLYTLKEAGVGAICLQAAKTQFSMNSLENNATNAVIRQTGIFLYENGGVGTVQHLDLAT